MSLRKWFVTASLIVAATAVAPAKASADWLFTPFIGSTFSGSANFGGGGEDFKNDFSRNLTYGASLEWMGGGVFGFGFDVGYSPNFFRPSSNDTFSLVGDGNVTTAMANLIIGAPLGAIRPYASGGLGVIKQKVDNVGQFFDSVDSSNLGFNAGAGVMGFFTNNIGIRGDIRFFRSMHDSDPNGVNLDLGQFKFWRGTVGVTFKF